MTPKAKELKLAANKALKAFENYQNKCKHLKVKRVPRSNTGNYDPSSDSYWYDCTCDNCGKIWDEDQ